MPSSKVKYGFYRAEDKRTYWYATPNGEKVEVCFTQIGKKRSILKGYVPVGEVLGMVGIAKRPPISNMKKIIGETAYRALREGRAYLYIWRRSSPYNWYIETIKRKKTLWHSDTSGWGTPKPDIRDFELVENSDESILYSWKTNNTPEKSTYRIMF